VPNGHAWEDSRADLVRRTVALILRHSTDLEAQMATLQTVTEPDALSAERTNVASIRRWARTAFDELGLTDRDLPDPPKRRAR
jgi:hypothetical protein